MSQHQALPYLFFEITTLPASGNTTQSMQTLLVQNIQHIYNLVAILSYRHIVAL